MATAPRTKETRGPKLEPHQVILQPLVTEKGTHQFTRHNAYPFQVNLWATKDQIKSAVEELFNVRVSISNKPANPCKTRPTSFPPPAPKRGGGATQDFSNVALS